MKISDEERIIAAWAAPCDGPGWRNCPVIVLVQHKRTGEYREEFLQPEEQTEGMHHLYRVSAEIQEAMTFEAKGLQLRSKEP